MVGPAPGKAAACVRAVLPTRRDEFPGHRATHRVAVKNSAPPPDTTRFRTLFPKHATRAGCVGTPPVTRSDRAIAVILLLPPPQRPVKKPALAYHPRVFALATHQEWRYHPALFWLRSLFVRDAPSHCWHTTHSQSSHGLDRFSTEGFPRLRTRFSGALLVSLQNTIEVRGDTVRWDSISIPTVTVDVFDATERGPEANWGEGGGGGGGGGAGPMRGARVFRSTAAGDAAVRRSFILSDVDRTGRLYTLSQQRGAATRAARLSPIPH
jgi:hypothetical protein